MWSYLLNEKIPEHHFTLVPTLKLPGVTMAAGRGGFEFVLTNPSSYAEIEMLHDLAEQVKDALRHKKVNMWAGCHPWITSRFMS